jgi:hypothetical protein
MAGPVVPPPANVLRASGLEHQLGVIVSGSVDFEAAAKVVMSFSP